MASPGPGWASLKGEISGKVFTSDHLHLLLASEPAPSSSSVAPSEDELDQMNADDLLDPPRKRKATHLSSPGAKRPRVGSDSNANRTSLDDHGTHPRLSFPCFLSTFISATESSHKKSGSSAIAGSSRPLSVPKRRFSSPSLSFGLSQNAKKNGIRPLRLDPNSSSAATKPVRRTRREKERQRSSESPPPTPFTAPQARSQMLSLASQVPKKAKKSAAPTQGSSAGQGKLGISLKSGPGQNRRKHGLVSLFSFLMVARLRFINVQIASCCRVASQYRPRGHRDIGQRRRYSPQA